MGGNPNFFVFPFFVLKTSRNDFIIIIFKINIWDQWSIFWIFCHMWVINLVLLKVRTFLSCLDWWLDEYLWNLSGELLLKRLYKRKKCLVGVGGCGGGCQLWQSLRIQNILPLTFWLACPLHSVQTIHYSVSICEIDFHTLLLTIKQQNGYKKSNI